MAENKCFLQPTDAERLTHNRKRSGGGNGTESTVVSDFPEQKGPQSAGKRHSEGWQSVGKDEISESFTYKIWKQEPPPHWHFLTPERATQPKRKKSGFGLTLGGDTFT